MSETPEYSGHSIGCILNHLPEKICRLTGSAGAGQEPVKIKTQHHPTDTSKIIITKYYNIDGETYSETSEKSIETPRHTQMVGTRHRSRGKLEDVHTAMMDQIIDIADVFIRIRSKARLILKLFFFEGRSQQDIADDMQCSQPNISQQIKRTCNYMADILNGIKEKPAPSCSFEWALSFQI